MKHALSAGFLTALLLITAISLASQNAQASEAYRTFALQLINSAPQDVQFRDDLEARLNARASGYRVTNDRSNLAPSELLRDAARAQALEMLLGAYVGHQSESGARFEARFQAFAGYDVPAFGENAARETQGGSNDEARADRLFQQWVDSTGHRRNLMNRDYDFVSSGVVQRGDHIYAIQIYWQKEQPPQGLDALMTSDPDELEQDSF